MAKQGDIRQLTLNKINLRVTGGTGFARITGPYEKESIPTSGKPDIKRTKRTEDVTSVEIQASGSERELVRDMSESLKSIDMSYTTAEGSNYTTSGEVEITDDDAVDGKLTLKLLPVEDWTPTVI